MRSMTGFGKSSVVLPNGNTASIEISAVNRKQFELRTSLPNNLLAWEVEIRKYVASQVERGSVQLRVTINNSKCADSLQINSELLESLVNDCKEYRRKFNLPDEVDVEKILTVPGVLTVKESTLETSSLDEEFYLSLKEAVNIFNAMRETEGASLKKDFSLRLENLRKIVEKIKPLVEDLPKIYRKKLLEKIEEENIITLDNFFNDERFLKELLFFADKVDVSEELTRLESHFCQLENMLNSTTAIGRSIDFLIQEMFREINTLGNKATSSAISPSVIEFKSELEKLREQVQNVE